MDAQQLKDDAAAGKLSIERLLIVIKAQQKRIAQLEEQIKAKNPTERPGKRDGVNGTNLRPFRLVLAL